MSLVFIESGELDMYNFSYDTATKEFSVAGARVTLADAKNNMGSPFLGARDITPTPSTELQSIVLSQFNPISRPCFNDWVSSPSAVESLYYVPEVMRTAYADLEGITLNSDKNTDSLWGFSVSFLRAEYGHIRLSTVGNCACMGVAANGYLVSYQDWQTKYAEYEFHNIDFATQKISLLAGLGFLANECNRQV